MNYAQRRRFRAFLPGSRVRLIDSAGRYGLLQFVEFPADAEGTVLEAIESDAAIVVQMDGHAPDRLHFGWLRLVTADTARPPH